MVYGFADPDVNVLIRFSVSTCSVKQVVLVSMVVLLATVQAGPIPTTDDSTTVRQRTAGGTWRWHQPCSGSNPVDLPAGTGFEGATQPPKALHLYYGEISDKSLRGFHLVQEFKRKYVSSYLTLFNFLFFIFIKPHMYWTYAYTHVTRYAGYQCSP